jgi:hypothetical protein
MDHGGKVYTQDHTLGEPAQVASDAVRMAVGSYLDDIRGSLKESGPHR